MDIEELAFADVKKKLLKIASETCDTLLVRANDVEKAKKTGLRVAANSDNSDIFVLETFDEKKLKKLKRKGKQVAVKVAVFKREDEKNVAKAVECSSDYIILKCPNWKVIPLENVIAKTQRRTILLAKVRCAEDAKLALETLELGADGVVLENSDIYELMKTAALFKTKPPKIKLTPVEIVRLKPIRSGARVCIDTCDLMKPGEGILSGCQSNGLFLIQAEVHQNPFVETRPFRVNAGSIALYTLSSLDKTKYLSELKAGDEVLIVDREGNVRLTNIGRVKIEWRPMIFVEAEYAGKKIKTIVQNAETLRFVAKNGSKSIAELKKGDKILAHISEGGRHFGVLVKEEKVIER